VDPQLYAEAMVIKLARHFGLPEVPKVRVGCAGCPFYEPGRGCRLGYVACYDPETKTITFSSPAVINELVATHELMHFVVDSMRSGVRLGLRRRRRRGYDVFRAISAVSTLVSTIVAVAGLKIAWESYKRLGEGRR